MEQVFESSVPRGVVIGLTQLCDLLEGSSVTSAEKTWRQNARLVTYLGFVFLFCLARQMVFFWGSISDIVGVFTPEKGC